MSRVGGSITPIAKTARGLREKLCVRLDTKIIVTGVGLIRA